MIPPLVELIVGEDKPGEKNTLRPLVEAEVIKVVEALLLGQSVEAARSDQLAPVVALLPEQLKRLAPDPRGTGGEARDDGAARPGVASDGDALEQQRIRSLRHAAPHGRVAAAGGEAVHRKRRLGRGAAGVTARVLKEVLGDARTEAAPSSAAGARDKDEGWMISALGAIPAS